MVIDIWEGQRRGAQKVIWGGKQGAPKRPKCHKGTTAVVQPRPLVLGVLGGQEVQGFNFGFGRTKNPKWNRGSICPQASLQQWLKTAQILKVEQNAMWGSGV